MADFRVQLYAYNAFGRITPLSRTTPPPHGLGWMGGARPTHRLPANQAHSRPIYTSITLECHLKLIFPTPPCRMEGIIGSLDDDRTHSQRHIHQVITTLIGNRWSPLIDAVHDTSCFVLGAVFNLKTRPSNPLYDHITLHHRRTIVRVQPPKIAEVLYDCRFRGG